MDNEPSILQALDNWWEHFHQELMTKNLEIELDSVYKQTIENFQFGKEENHSKSKYEEA